MGKYHVWVIRRMGNSIGDRQAGKLLASHQPIKSIQARPEQSRVNQSRPQLGSGRSPHQFNSSSAALFVNTLPGFGKFGQRRRRTMEGNKMSSKMYTGNRFTLKGAPPSQYGSNNWRFWVAKIQATSWLPPITLLSLPISKIQKETGICWAFITCFHLAFLVSFQMTLDIFRPT